MGAMAAMQRRLPCFVVTQKLRDVGNKFRFIFPFMSVFFSVFFPALLLLFRAKWCCFFLLLLFPVILAVSVCLCQSFCCSLNAFVLVLVAQKN